MLGHGVGQRGDLAAAARHRDALGLCVGPDDIYLGLRGLRTMGVRLAHHHQAGLKVARWLEQRPGGRCACCIRRSKAIPATRIWQRDFSGASGLFSVVLKPVPETAVNAFLDALTLFGIGASWGGYESLAIPFDCAEHPHRDHMGAGRADACASTSDSRTSDDLIADLERGFAALAAARISMLRFRFRVVWRQVADTKLGIKGALATL